MLFGEMERDLGDQWHVGDEKEADILALVKKEERYIFIWDEDSRAEMLRVLGQFASDPELGFTRYDAAVLSQKVRQLTKEKGS